MTELGGPEPGAGGQREHPGSTHPAEASRLTGWNELGPAQGSGQNRRILLEDPTEHKLWLFKPASGERYLAYEDRTGINMNERWRRAAAAALLAEQSGFETPAVRLVEWKGERGSLQEWHAGYTVGDELYTKNPQAFKDFMESQTRLDMDAFDFFLGNQDRHGGNWMIKMVGKEPQLMLIDQDYSIPAGPGRNYQAQEPTPGAHSERFVRDLPPSISFELAKKFRGLNDNFPVEQLSQWLNPAEIDGLRSRLSVVITKIDQGQIRVLPEHAASGS